MNNTQSPVNDIQIVP